MDWESLKVGGGEGGSVTSVHGCSGLEIAEGR